MYKPCKDTLEQYTYDFGYNKALTIFQLTEKQYNNIMYGEPCGVSIKKYKDISSDYTPLTPINYTEDANVLINTLVTNYKKIYNKKCPLKDQIDARALNSEDKLHEAILRLLKNANDFNLDNDQPIYNYIIKSLKNSKINLYHQANRELINIGKYSQLDLELSDYQFDPFIEEDFKKTLNDQERAVLFLIHCGMINKEIADKMQIDRARITRIIKQIKIKIKNY